MSGRVVLLGAGPGDPDLLTVRGLRELERAEVLLYDALLDPAILLLAPPDCERIDVGKRGDGTKGIAQDKIADLLIEKARAGKRVVRLKGGDPFVFGRGGEEATRLAEAGIPFEVVPGISSAIAVPMRLGPPSCRGGVPACEASVTSFRPSGTPESDVRNGVIVGGPRGGARRNSRGAGQISVTSVSKVTYALRRRGVAGDGGKLQVGDGGKLQAGTSATCNLPPSPPR